MPIGAGRLVLTLSKQSIITIENDGNWKLSVHAISNFHTFNLLQFQTFPLTLVNNMELEIKTINYASLRKYVHDIAKC